MLDATPEGGAFGQVFQRTINFSFPAVPVAEEEVLVGLVVGDVEVPFLIIRSDKMMSLTLPRTGTRPHATGLVHSAAVYAILPVTVGRCGCVEGKSLSVIWGERISCGRGEMRREGRRSWRILIAISNF